MYAHRSFRMVDSVNSKPENMYNNSMVDSLTDVNTGFSMAKANFAVEISSLGGLSDAEIKFLSLSKEKKSSVELIENLLHKELTCQILILSANFKMIMNVSANII